MNKSRSALTQTIVVDAILVLQNAVDKTPSWIHIVTVVYMLIVSWMLYQEEKKEKYPNK